MTTTATRPAPAAVTTPPLRDTGLLAVALVAVSTSGPLVAAAAAPALAVAFWRNALATAVLTPVALTRRLGELRGLTGRERRLALLAGVLLAAHFATWIPSLRLTSVASATALVATQPVWSGLVARLRGQRVAGRAWLGVVVALAGAALLSGVDVSASAGALAGDLLATVGGLFAALYVTAGEAVRRSVTTTTYTTLCYGTCAGLLLVVCLVSRQSLAGYSGTTWLQILGLTAGAQLLGHSLFNVVLRSTSATVVSLAILLEVPGAALVAAVFLGQRPPLLALPAVGLLLAGLTLVVSTRERGVPAAVPVE